MCVPDATLYHFGILTSTMHNAWVRYVAGRLKSDYRYSAQIVYNNFPWPTAPTEKHSADIEPTKPSTAPWTQPTSPTAARASTPATVSASPSCLTFTSG